MKKLIKKYWFIFLFVLLAGAGTIYFQSTKQKQSSSKKKTEKIYTVERKTVKQILSLSGKIDASQKAELRFQSSGRLTWVGVKEGEWVKKYQAIASLDAREVQKTLQKALIDYSEQRNDFEETWRVDYKGISNPQIALTDTVKRILEKNQWDLEKAVLDVELKHLSTEYATLTTPIEGIVTHIDTPFAGVNITPAQAVFDVVNSTTLYLSVLADQTEVGKLSASTAAEIIFDAYPEEKITGSIDAIAFIPKSGESTTVYEVKVNLPSETINKYRIGMTADATFIVGQKENVLVIPSQTIKKDKDQRYVTKIVGDKRERTPVTVGDDFEDNTEIISGLNEGDVLSD